MDFYRPKTKKEKDRNLLLKKIFIFGGLFLILAIFGGLVFFIRYSEFFIIKKISVSNFQTVSSEELIGNLENFFTENYKSSSLLGPENILFWKSNTVRFLEKYPQFEKLKIEKKFFSKEVIINGEERKRFGIWCQITTYDLRPMTDNCGWFDKKGIIFSEAPVIETEIINRVNDFSGRYLKVGDFILSSHLITNLTLVFDILDKANLNTKTIFLKDLDLEEVETNTTISAPKIYFSLRFNPGFSIAAINSLKKSGQWEKIDYVDFRVENRVYYK